MSTETPNIRPGVRGVCRNGFWTPVIEWDETPNLWYAGGRVWFAGGKYYSSSQRSEWDIVAIVEDLPKEPIQHVSLQEAVERYEQSGGFHEAERITDPGIIEYLRVLADAYMNDRAKGNDEPSQPQGGDSELPATPGYEDLIDPEAVLNRDTDLCFLVREYTTWQEVRGLHEWRIKDASSRWRFRRRIAPQVEMMKTDPGGFNACAQAVDAMRKQKGHWVPAEHYVPPAEFAQLKADAEKWREHVKNPQPQIPGMPVGWEIWRCNAPDSIPDYVDNVLMSVEIRRITPPQPKLIGDTSAIADGWVCQDEDDELCWFEVKPVLGETAWHIAKIGTLLAYLNSHRNPPKFREDLPWDQRCVQIRDGREVVE